MKTIKNILMSMLLCIGFFSHPRMYGAPHQPSLLETIKPGTTPDQLSPEQLVQLEKEYKAWEAQAKQEVDEFVKTLSDEEKVQFQKDVQDLTEQMSKMNPEELVQFIETMFPAETQNPSYPIEETKKEACDVEPAPLQEPVHKQSELHVKDANSVLSIINDIIMHTERFLRTAQMIPELPGTITQWVSQQALREWNIDLTWEKVKARIEALDQKLHLMKEKDPRTGNYRYLSAVLKDEALYNNLLQLRTTLTMHEPKVQAPAFGLGKVTEDSRRAIKMVLNNYAEAIYKLMIPDALDKAMGTYEPRAKELREAEEASRKRAVEESKKNRTEAPRREIGSPQKAGHGGGYGASEGTGYGNYSGYTPSTGGYSPYDAGDYGYTSQHPSAGPKQGGTSGGGGFDGGKKPADKAAEEKAKKEADEKVKKEQAGQQKPGETPKLDATLQRLRDKIAGNLEAIEELISDNDHLPTIQKHMTTAAQPVDMNLAGDVLPKVVRKFKTVLDQVKEYKQGIGKKNIVDVGMKELKNIAGEFKKLFDGIRKQIDAIKDGKGATPDKTYAYLGGMNQNNASPNLVASLPQPASLAELGELMAAFDKESSNFASDGGKKAAAQAQAPAAQAPAPVAPQAQQPAQPHVPAGQAQQQEKKKAASQAAPAAQAPAAPQAPVAPAPAVQPHAKRSAAAQQAQQAPHAQPQIPTPSAPPAPQEPGMPSIDDMMANIDTAIATIDKSGNLEAMQKMYQDITAFHAALPADLKPLLEPRIKRIEDILARMQPEGQ